MSTILDALRKTKQTPPEKSVDARGEILSSHSHNYLADASTPINEEIIYLKFIIMGAAAVIVLLCAILGVVLLRDPNKGANQSLPESQSGALSAPDGPPTAAPTPTPSPSPSSAALAAPPRATPSADPPVNSPTPFPISPEAEATPIKTPAPAAIVSALASEERRIQAIESLNQLRGAGFGIVWDETNPMAMIGGQTIKKGSRIGTAEVVRITPNTIVFLIEGEEYSLGQ